MEASENRLDPRVTPQARALDSSAQAIGSLARSFASTVTPGIRIF